MRNVNLPTSLTYIAVLMTVTLSVNVVAADNEKATMKKITIEKVQSHTKGKILKGSSSDKSITVKPAPGGSTVMPARAKTVGAPVDFCPHGDCGSSGSD